MSVASSLEVPPGWAGAAFDMQQGLESDGRLATVRDRELDHPTLTEIVNAGFGAQGRVWSPFSSAAGRRR